MRNITPLTALGNRWSPFKYLDDGLASLPGEKAHEQSTHDGKVIGHVKLIAFAKILDYFPPATGWLRQATAHSLNGSRRVYVVVLESRESGAGFTVSGVPFE